MTRTKILARSRRPQVNLLGEELLADAALAEDEHGRVRLRDPLNQVELFDDERGLGDQIVPALLCLDLVAKVVDLILGLFEVTRVLDGQRRLDGEKSRASEGRPG